MLRKDYLMRMIEEMTEAVGSMMGLRREHKNEQALEKLDGLLKRNFRMSERMLRSLPPEELILLFQQRGGVDAESLQLVARMLQENGEIRENMGEEQEAASVRIKALHLYLYAALNGGSRELVDYPQRISELTAQLERYRLPAEAEKLVMLYEEREGRYIQAEDAMFRMLNASPIDDENALEEGRMFYARLAALDDEQLRSGGLSRLDLEEGIEALQDE
ncbi:DUF6483 family protein [Saccharibacillus kuerlensis]|uniref:Uncharacterized protein n=1 Tax=Saccharibacillus kuerlensis TaxID=459527 RepID=A0ABQ2L9H7_9BACL|nr:DUF6483 family protein [Saccharibacillus kuerlensis]GGO07651.1 hypothetical protein GCM10010969_36300 [Saccharibacillus kuerlensis]